MLFYNCSFPPGNGLSVRGTGTVPTIITQWRQRRSERHEAIKEERAARYKAFREEQIARINKIDDEIVDRKKKAKATFDRRWYIEADAAQPNMPGYLLYQNRELARRNASAFVCCSENPYYQDSVEAEMLYACRDLYEEQIELYKLISPVNLVRVMFIMPLEAKMGPAKRRHEELAELFSAQAAA